MPFSTAKYEDETVGSNVLQGRTRAAVLMASLADEFPSQASDLLADELLNLRDRLAHAQRSCELLPSLLRTYRKVIDFETFEKRDGEDWGAEERVLWVRRLKALELDLVAGLNAVPEISTRIAFAAPTLVTNRRATIAQLEDNLQWARGRLLLLHVGARELAVESNMKPSASEGNLVDALSTLSTLSGGES